MHAKRSKEEVLQKEHYDNLIAVYDSHYDDKYSQKYRRKFVNDQLFKGIDLRGSTVLEAMCGSGMTTGYLLEKEAVVTGLDISDQCVTLFKERWPDCEVLSGSIINTGYPNESFDCISIVGGLHHLHPDVDRAVSEIHRILNPGGYFCFLEPHKGSFPDLIRKIWYKHDHYFQENEAAIDLDAMKKKFSYMFEFIREKYTGNVAYMFVNNSMIFRVPLYLKSLYAPLLLLLESVIQPFQGKRASCIVICQWKKL